MRTRVVLVAALVAAAAPLAGTASAKCTQPMSTVCAAYSTVCSKVDKIDCAQP
jgi:hypothetical protein